MFGWLAEDFFGNFSPFKTPKPVFRGEIPAKIFLQSVDNSTAGYQQNIRKKQ